MQIDTNGEIPPDFISAISKKANRPAKFPVFMWKLSFGDEIEGQNKDSNTNPTG